METSARPISSADDLAPLREALGWLTGRECWQAHYGYDLALDFGPARAMWPPALVARSMSAGVAFDRRGALCFWTESSSWTWRLPGGDTLSDEDGEEEIDVALAVVSRRVPVVLAADVAYPSLGVELRFDDGSVLVVTPDAPPPEGPDEGFWCIAADPFPGGPVGAAVTVCAAPRRCVLERP
jgi:hypothetical protein